MTLQMWRMPATNWKLEIKLQEFLNETTYPLTYGNIFDFGNQCLPHSPKEVECFVPLLRGGIKVNNSSNGL